MKSREKREKYEKTRFSIFRPKKNFFEKRRHFGRVFDISPRKNPENFRKKPLFILYRKHGVTRLRKVGTPSKRAPDRPWAFRRGIPPAVVYRGTPPKYRGQSRNPWIFCFFLLFTKTVVYTTIKRILRGETQDYGLQPLFSRSATPPNSFS